MKIHNKYIRLNQKDRLYNLKIPIIGLTGGIATGKSTVSDYLEGKQHPVVCADQLVKKIYLLHDSIDFVKENAPECIKNNSIDFKVLRKNFFNSPVLKEKIENYIYKQLPLIFMKHIDDQEFLGSDLIRIP